MHTLKSQRGLTLVELLVTIIVMAILIPTICASIYSVIQSYAFAKDYSDLCSVISAVDGTIERELALASGSTIEGDAIRYLKNKQPTRMETSEVTYKGKQISVLVINGAPVCDPDSYENINISATFTIESGFVRVNVVYDGVVRHSSEFAVSKI